MDKGNDAKAVMVLENELKKHPDREDIRELLGSAYVGLAGINIYRIQDAFQDLLFRRSLKDEIIGGTSSAGPSATEPKSVTAKSPEDQKMSSTEEALRFIDRALLGIQKVAIYFTRLPQVPSEKWPYLEKALEVMETLEHKSNILVYRMLVRLLYTKAFLTEKFLRNIDFGDRRWACKIDPVRLREGFTFINEQVTKMHHEASTAVRLGARKISPAIGVLSHVQAVSQSFSQFLELPASPAIQGTDSQLRSALGCEKIP